MTTDDRFRIGGRTIGEILTGRQPEGSSIGTGPMPAEAFDPDNLRRGTRVRSVDRQVSQERTIPPNQRQQLWSPIPPEPPVAPRLDDFVTPPDQQAQGGMSGGMSGGPGFDPTSGLGHIQAAQQRAAQALGSLDQMFEERKSLLREQYQLSETPEEKAKIQHVHDMIEVMRDEGTKVIERVYSGAIEQAAEHAQRVREQGLEAGQRTRETFQGVAEDTADMFHGLADQFGGAMGAGGEPLPAEAAGVIADLQRQAASQGAFDERMFGLSADDIDFLGQAMAPEGAARVAQFQGDATALSSRAQMQHDERVQDRIAAERMAYQQALQQLAQFFDTRRFGLEDQQIALGQSAAELEASNQIAAAQLAQQQRQFAQQQSTQLTPQQELEMRQAEIDYERAIEEFERRQQAEHLRRISSLPPAMAEAAAALGLGPRVGEAVITQQFDPVNQVSPR